MTGLDSRRAGCCSGAMAANPCPAALIHALMVDPAVDGRLAREIRSTPGCRVVGGALARLAEGRP